MLISFRKYDDDDFERDYIAARKKLDVLCGLIISGRISRSKAENIYREIKREYMDTGPENAELFRMIYDNRIRRLCDQFCPD